MLLHTNAGADGTFVADIRMNVLGSCTFVAAGIGANGQTRYLEATSNRERRQRVQTTGGWFRRWAAAGGHQLSA